MDRIDELAKRVEALENRMKCEDEKSEPPPKSKDPAIEWFKDNTGLHIDSDGYIRNDRDKLVTWEGNRNLILRALTLLRAVVMGPMGPEIDGPFMTNGPLITKGSGMMMAACYHHDRAIAYAALLNAAAEARKF